MIFRLIQISENIDKISNEFKLKNNQIPWKAIKGLRNKLVHDYGNVDITFVYDAITKDIIELK